MVAPAFDPVALYDYDTPTSAPAPVDADRASGYVRDLVINGKMETVFGYEFAWWSEAEAIAHIEAQRDPSIPNSDPDAPWVAQLAEQNSIGANFRRGLLTIADGKAGDAIRRGLNANVGPGFGDNVVGGIGSVFDGFQANKLILIGGAALLALVVLK